MSASRLDEIFLHGSEEEGFERVLLKYKWLEIQRVVAGPNALDVGCGVGIITRLLADTVERVVGLDGSSAKIERAKALTAAPNVAYVCSLFEDWSSADRFDTIVATNILEHVSDSGAFLAWCRRLLAPSGRLIVTVPNALGLHKRVGKEAGFISDVYALTAADHEKGHLRTYDRAILARELADAGFSQVDIRGILLKPLSSKQMESWDPRTVDALYEIGKGLPDYCSSILAVAQV